MVETLIESSANVEAFDINGDGVISHKEFRHAMMQQKMYSEEEIEYIMNCVDANQDGKVDFNEFTERFHNPAKEIGFNLALLLVNLHEHIPNDPRLERLVGKAQCMLDYFEPYLGRIEILGSSGRIERVYFEVTQSNIDQWEAPQIKESKRSFLYSVINEGGDKEKLESFINFCEDTIFEMQHAQRVSGEGEGLSIRQVAAVKAILEGERVKRVSSALSSARRFASRNFRSLFCGFFAVLRGLTPASLVRGAWRLFLALLTFVFFVVKSSFAYLGRLALALAFAPEDTGLEVQEALQAKQPWLLTEEEQLALERLDPRELCALDEAKVDQSSDLQRRDSFEFDGPTTFTEEEELECETPTIDTSTFILSLFARNFYNFKLLALGLAFFINFILLFFRVTSATDGAAAGAAAGEAAEGGIAAAVTEAVKAAVNATVEAVTNATEAAGATAAEAEEPEEWVTLSDSVYYLRPLLRVLAALHTCFALSMLIAYNCLKVPLVVFKREKEISRMLEFDGMWISEQPGEDNIGAHWDKLVLPTPSFPDMYWDKFVKKKVLNKFQDQFDEEQIVKLLGMKKSDEAAPSPGLISRLLGGLDVQYLVWKWGVILTDNSFLYLLFYLIASLIGNFNQFFFACHLLDVAIGFKTLRTILQSVTHNGKQLVLTVLLTSIIIYLYTVLAFNFFRRFYVKEGDGGAKDLKCHDMLTCFVFHMHTGLRAGGGIGDEIESPDGDPYEVYRILFDITFFFFVIVILLAIIQGLIIDAFGELRDQLEQVKENMESNCFICGIGKEYFDKVPHGFDKHVDKEHNFANYMFFLMHLINKPDTEYTGQETYVWELYQKRCWDFFPVGDCFRKQYEDELKSQGLNAQASPASPVAMSSRASSSPTSPSSSAVASWYCWYSDTRSFMLLSASVNSISSMPSPVYQKALRLNMAVNCSDTRLNSSWMAVELPMKPRERHHVDGQLPEVGVELAGEPQAGGHAGHGGAHQVVQVAVGRGGQLQRAEADVVQGLVVDAVGFVRVLNKLVHRQGGVVFMMRSGYSSLILEISRVPMPLPVPPPSEWVSWKPSLGLLAHHIEHGVHQLGALSVVALGPVVAGAALSEHEVVRPEQVSERAGPDTVHGARLQVHQHGPRDVLASAGLIIVHVDALQLQVRVTVGDLLLGGGHRVRAVHDVAASHDAIVAADGAGQAVNRLGGAQHHAADLDHLLALPDHADHRAGQHVVDKAGEERLGLEIAIVLLKQRPAGLHHLHGNQAEAALLESLDDFANKAALDTVRLDHDVTTGSSLNIAEGTQRSVGRAVEDESVLFEKRAPLLSVDEPVGRGCLGPAQLAAVAVGLQLGEQLSLAPGQLVHLADPAVLAGQEDPAKAQQARLRPQVAVLGRVADAAGGAVAGGLRAEVGGQPQVPAGAPGAGQAVHRQLQVGRQLRHVGVATGRPAVEFAPVGVAVQQGEGALQQLGGLQAELVPVVLHNLPLLGVPPDAQHAVGVAVVLAGQQAAHRVLGGQRQLHVCLQAGRQPSWAAAPATLLTARQDSARPTAAAARERTQHSSSWKKATSSSEAPSTRPLPPPPLPEALEPPEAPPDRPVEAEEAPPAVCRRRAAEAAAPDLPDALLGRPARAWRLPPTPLPLPALSSRLLLSQEPRRRLLMKPAVAGAEPPPQWPGGNGLALLSSCCWRRSSLLPLSGWAGSGDG
uniref:EF-hand domain-containing protein n=1 Tax=Macrostomum lignano TaxID=282301 RepID=A0A1I8I891_9PLAT